LRPIRRVVIIRGTSARTVASGGDVSPRASRKEVLAWCLYDFADSSFTTLIVTVAYGLYFRSVVAGDLGAVADLYWGISISVSMIAVAILSPVLGAIADASARKKFFLAGFALTSIAFTASLVTVGRGDLWMGMLLFIIANIGYEGAHVFYNGFLLEVASEADIGRISGYGWATGYIGGLVALLVAYPLTSAGLGPEGAGTYRLTFPLVALFFLVFSLPLFVTLRERAVAAKVRQAHRFREGLRRLRETFRHVRRLKDLLRFLLAFVVYNDGVATVIAFSAIYAMHVIGFSVTQLSAFAGAFGAGYLVDFWGARRTILLTLVLWCGTVTGAYLVHSVPAFFVVGIAASLGMGSTQTASRSLMGLLIPPGRNAEFFGFYALTGKVSAVVGPLLYGTVAAWAGSERPAVLSLVLFFLAGLGLLLLVDVPRGRAAAERHPRGLDDPHGDPVAS
jgi:UMF1 family MFS transporter